MATSNSKPLLLQTQKPFSLLVISITLFFLLLNKVNSSKVLSFTFTNFVPNQKDIVLQGNAVVSSTGELQLTKVQKDKPIWNSVGRALYVTPIHIWDRNTGRVASFVSSFSFVVKAPDTSKIADGIAFFLASPDSDVKTSGGLLGLFSSTFYNSSNQVVAVEFDTFLNPWDPNARHIGININSIQSTKTVTWNWKNGELANVVINYQASTKTLTASLTYLASKTSYVISEVVDLKGVLPEWVRVGFSASSGLRKNYAETHDVLSWSFSSTLQTS